MDDWRVKSDPHDSWYQHRIYAGDMLIANVLAVGWVGQEIADGIVRDHNEADRLREGIRRYMADDPPCATNCASLDPYPSRGAPCDCGVEAFIKAALGESLK